MAEDVIPPVDDAYQAFMGKCMQDMLDAMPDMGARRAHCQAQWDAAHPAETTAAGRRAAARAETPAPPAETPKP